MVSQHAQLKSALIDFEVWLLLFFYQRLEKKAERSSRFVNDSVKEEKVLSRIAEVKEVVLQQLIKQFISAQPHYCRFWRSENSP